MHSEPESPADAKSRLTYSQRLVIVLVSNVALLGGLFIVGLAAHSLGVFAEGVDYLAGAAAVGVALWAV